jgi:hypothetical protein
MAGDRAFFLSALLVAIIAMKGGVKLAKRECGGTEEPAE